MLGVASPPKVIPQVHMLPAASMNRVVNATSPGWSGYAAYSPKQDYTEVQAMITVPRANCKNAKQFFQSSGEWVGLGGTASTKAEQKANLLLAQGGITLSCIAQTPTYYAFVELYPRQPTDILLSARAYPVGPGDKILVTVIADGKNRFEVHLLGVTANWAYTAIYKNVAPRHSAEVIVEAPGNSAECNTTDVCPLTDFGAQNFSQIKITIGSSLAPTSFMYRIYMKNKNPANRANPGTLSYSKRTHRFAFGVAFGGN